MNSFLEKYSKRAFEAPLRTGYRVTHDIYESGTGPSIILIQELPGIGAETFLLADRLLSAGFRVVIPHLFGPLGKTSSFGNLVRVFCLRKEFTLFQKSLSSPITDWLSALCQDTGNRSPGNKVGVIGMCLTGNFAISLMAEESVVAAVASQPSLPILSNHDLHMSEEEISSARQCLEQEGPMLAFRFEGDRLCTHEKFEAIRSRFNNDGIERVILKSLPGKGHSVLTLDFVDQDGHPTSNALKDVLSYFERKLKKELVLE